jgi:hypothetical protein
MDIEHSDRLSWFSRRGERHEQDGEILIRAVVPRAGKVSGDPAMAFVPPVRRTGALCARFKIGSAIAAGGKTDR